HVGRSRNHARDVVDLHFERTPIVQNVLGCHQNMRVKIDYLLSQLAIEAGHNRDHENEHSHAERYPKNRDECDNGEKRAFRFEITQREEKAERQFQVAVMLAANATLYNPTGW